MVGETNYNEMPPHLLKLHPSFHLYLLVRNIYWAAVAMCTNESIMCTLLTKFLKKFH